MPQKVFVGEKRESRGIPAWAVAIPTALLVILIVLVLQRRPPAETHNGPATQNESAAKSATVPAAPQYQQAVTPPQQRPAQENPLDVARQTAQKFLDADSKGDKAAANSLLGNDGFDPLRRAPMYIRNPRISDARQDIAPNGIRRFIAVSGTADVMTQDAGWIGKEIEVQTDLKGGKVTLFVTGNSRERL